MLTLKFTIEESNSVIIPVHVHVSDSDPDQKAGIKKGNEIDGDFDDDKETEVKETESDLTNNVINDGQEKECDSGSSSTFTASTCSYSHIKKEEKKYTFYRYSDSIREDAKIEVNISLYLEFGLKRST